MAPEKGVVGYRTTYIVLCLGVLAYALPQAMVIPALPTIEHSLHTSQQTVTWLLVAYLLSASVSTPIVGRLGDLTGKKRMFVVALSAMALGNLVSALAPGIGLMVVGRAIQGIGGGVLPLAFGIMREELPLARVGNAVATAAALVAAGGGFGFIIAGPIIDLGGYRSLYWTAMGVVVVAAIGARCLLPESKVRAPGSVSWFGAAILAAWLVMLLLAVSEAPTWGWASGRVLGLVAGAMVIAALWVRMESRSQNPVVDISTMRIPAVWTTNVASFLFGMAMYASVAVIPAFVQVRPGHGYGFGASATGTAVYLLPQTVVMFLVGMAVGPLTNRFGSRLVVLAGAALVTLGYGLLAGARTSPWEVYIASGVIGAGFGGGFSGMSNLMVAAVPLEHVGAANGINVNCRTLGGAFGTATATSIIAVHSLEGVPLASGYTHGFAALAGAAALSALVAALIPRRRAALETAAATMAPRTA